MVNSDCQNTQASGQSFNLYEDRGTRERLQVALPLQSFVNVEKMRLDVGIPDYVDLTSFQMQKTAAAMWACRIPGEATGATGRPPKVALFGGAAFKLRCPSSNKGPFYRTIGDIDFVTLREDGKRVIQVLCNLDQKCGSMFFHGLSSSDKRFNALRAGMRYRLHTIKDVDAHGVPTSGLMDVFCDELPFCHKLNVREELNNAVNQLTIGLESMLISKTQMIKKVAKDEAGGIDEKRILRDYDRKHFLIGMEIKDMQDVAALVLDHDLGKSIDEINVEVLGPKLKRDWGMWTTVTLNLRNMLQRFKLMVAGNESQQDVIKNRLAEIIDQLENKYAAEKKIFNFTKQWWEDVEDQAAV